MPPETIACPDCDLVLRVAHNADWKRRCKRRNLDNPAWCLIRQDGATAKEREIALPPLNSALTPLRVVQYP
jgi:hypothetical protein